MWEEGPGWKAGIRPGDQVVRVADVNVSNYAEALVEMKKSKVGERTTVTVMKPKVEGETKQKKVQYKLIPMTNKPEYAELKDIYFDTSKTTTNKKIGAEKKTSSSSKKK